jgi:type IX secretion system PorP/SprF family membrane protein
MKQRNTRIVSAPGHGPTSAVLTSSAPSVDRWMALVLLHVALLLTFSLRAQDPQFSQFYASPLYLNPALTGNTYEDRLILNYRKQWPGTGPGYNTYAISYDHNYHKAHSGVGGLIVRDVAGTSNLAFTHAAIAYSYEARIDHKHAVRLGARLGWTRREYDPSGLVFADQVIRENAPSTIEAMPLQSTNYMDASAGVLYFSENFWFGTSFSHVNQPQQTLYTTGDVKLPIRTSVHTGYRFRMDGQHVGKAHTRMTVAAHYKAQQDWDQLDLGSYIDHDRLTFGLWYRGIPGMKAYAPGYANDESIIAMVGYETEQQLRFTYSYDITVSLLSMKSAGAHEISVIYEWPKRGRNKKYKAVPCPKF